MRAETSIVRAPLLTESPRPLHWIAFIAYKNLHVLNAFPAFNDKHFSSLISVSSLPLPGPRLALSLSYIRQFSRQRACRLVDRGGGAANKNKSVSRFGLIRPNLFFSSNSIILGVFPLLGQFAQFSGFSRSVLFCLCRSRPTLGTKVIADPERCIQELTSEKLLLLLRDTPSLESNIVSKL